MIPPHERAEFIARNRREAERAAPPVILPIETRPNRLVAGGLDGTPGGRLWATWLQHGESLYSHALLAYSDDDGATWSGPAFAVELPPTPGGLRRTSLCSNVFTAPDGRLLWIFDASLGIFDGEGGVWLSECADPDGDNPRWSPPRRLWHGHAVNKPIVRAGGEWLLAVSLWTFPTDDMLGDKYPCITDQELEDERRVHIFASGDGGKTWVRRGGVRVMEWSFNEPNLMERADGSLRMYLRSKKGIVETDSTDGGMTWTPYRLSELRHPPARMWTLKLRSGAWLMVKHAVPPDGEPKRQALTAYLSDDEGATWTGGLAVDERYGVSYPDGFQAADGRIFVSYDHIRTDGEFLLAAFREEDVRAGRAVSDQAFFKRPIHRLPGYADLDDNKFVHIKLIANQ